MPLGKELKVSENITRGLDEVECECPKCRTKHMIKMIWLGRGIPRKFCANCRKIRNEFADVHTERISNWRC